MLDITDGHLVNVFLFLGGTTLPSPGPYECGIDPTSDSLGCERLGRCSNLP